MTFLKAAENVLRQTGKPMTPKDIVEAAMSKGWLSTGGETPVATMRGQLGTHIKKGGKIFVRTSPGHFGLSGKNLIQGQPDLFDEAKKDSGYVYILTNPSFRRDWVKIGMTERPVNTRSKELDNTAVPLPFEIYATLKTNHRRKIEHLLHGFIEDIAPKKRIRKTREFFNIAPETALKLLVRAAEVFDEERYIDDVFRRRQLAAPASEPKSKQRQSISADVGHSLESWSNVTQLAKLVARRGGNEGAFGGILHYFSRKRPCVRTSKWRQPLEDIGVKFDAHDFVRDWQCAKSEF